MVLPLPIHLFIHFSLAVLVGYLVGRRCRHLWIGIMAGICGGFLIDLDHVLEYFLVFGWHFNIIDFFNGRQFLTSSQIHTFFHAWEYIPVLLILAWLLRQKRVVFTFLIAFTLAGFVHLVSDCVINNYPPRNYSLIYRYSVGFSVPKLLNPQQYQKFLEDQKSLGF